jgi:hypothetical protein
MHQKYAKDGLVAITVALDPIKEPSDLDKIRRAALPILKRHKMAYLNLILDEKPAVWEEKLNIVGPPSLWLFDRDGKLLKKDIDYDEIEKMVAKLFNRK